MRCWIDTQSYYSGNSKFIPKEVAIVTESVAHNFVVKFAKLSQRPTPSDDVSESDLADKITESSSGCTEIYTKGRDEQFWFSSVLKTPAVWTWTLSTVRVWQNPRFLSS
jgi:hypothetical protein